MERSARACPNGTRIGANPAGIIGAGSLELRPKRQVRIAQAWPGAALDAGLRRPENVSESRCNVVMQRSGRHEAPNFNLQLSSRGRT